MATHHFVKTLLGVAISAAISTTALAVDVIDKGFTVGLGGAYTDYDSARTLDNKVAPEVGIGYRFNDRFSLEGLYSKASNELKNGNDADLKDYRLDAFYDLTPWDGSLTPYLVAGIGEFKENIENSKDRDDTRLNVGFGLRKALTENLSLRGDLRALHGLDLNQTESMLNLALTWTFGAPSQPVQAEVTPEPEPQPQPIEPVPAPLDTDKDGVVDASDLCPNTDPGAAVDSVGCVPMEEIDLLVEFRFDSADILNTELNHIDEMGKFLQKYSDVKIKLEGHTDSQGVAIYNDGLSQQRADAVRKMLIEKFDIAGERIEAVGMGEKEPVAPNDTFEGRQKNRRVVAEILTQ
ncbi:OmpA family protein [Sansalvadorimonas sp. 2012CJ34-2]|uniref:OmpA family protein n=1 Tax=Parendozoicomonas callyspongiae TaxID=2942213 RepID=A0ABT0PKN0_9GAMM|nr:OmpA family protein [Sansalvadorimonas sp. 2012CJ34-2]MCL6271935.1 OmpA family protein [Sansalvadorimonas sp. 2012CJ34-2]